MCFASTCLGFLRHGGPDLRSTQAYPVPYGRKLADLAINAGMGKLGKAVDRVVAGSDLVGPTDTDPWEDAGMLPLHGFLRKCWADKPWL